MSHILHCNNSSVCVGVAAVTCPHSLPAYREGGPSLHHVHGNRTVVVGSRAPGQLHSGVSNVSHYQALRGTGRSYNTQKQGQTLTSASLHYSRQNK